MSPKEIQITVSNIRKMVQDNNKHLVFYINSLYRIPLVSRADIEAIKKQI
jgi:hypothetical protein